MIRENRYTTLKHKDIEGAMHNGWLTVSDYDNLVHICDQITHYREERGREELAAVVIESDWPEYEPTWKLLEDRIFAQESYL